jgi:hypothetical protein
MLSYEYYSILVTFRVGELRGRDQNCCGDPFYSLTAHNTSRAMPFEDFINTALNYLKYVNT